MIPYLIELTAKGYRLVLKKAVFILQKRRAKQQDRDQHHAQPFWKDC